MRLGELVSALPVHEVRGREDVDIRSIELDSRQVAGGALFVCLEGLARDGHDFAATAVSQGAVALLVCRYLEDMAGTPQVVVPDTREAMARLAAAFFDHPSRTLEVIGVTGTNGKTTVTHLLQGIARAASIPVEVLGTLGRRSGEAYVPTGFTTPEAPVLQGVLRQAADGGARWVAMEVSSHALAMQRTFATDFAAVVFTNLSRDHLDYHRNMDTYFEAKAALFDPPRRGSDAVPVALVNADDPWGRRLLARIGARAVTYGFKGGVDYRARRLRLGARETRYELVTPRGRRNVRLPLLGEFNVSNALAAQACALELGVSLDHAVEGTERLDGVPGRMERIGGSHPFLVLVDFAHTPEALANLLDAVRGLSPHRVTVVFGCGGDRDPGKRPEMGRVAANHADRVVITSDNPRHEDPARIIADIEAGAVGPAEIAIESDRAAAIRLAVAGARPGDAVVIAGKGHESVQVVGDTSRPFDDRREAADALKESGFEVER